MPIITIKKAEKKIIPLFWYGQSTDLDYQISLDYPGAQVEVMGILVGHKEKIAQLNLSIIHRAPRTTSKVNVRSIVYDQSQIQINGLVSILPGAKSADAWLAAHVLLLSSQARGQTIPSLEILENDVKAGHATTIGRVDDAVLFYLMSRGLTRPLAEKLIVDGFLQGVLNHLPSHFARQVERLW